MTTHASAKDLLAARLLGAVSDEEARAVDAHLDDCPECQADAAVLCEAVATLAPSEAASQESWLAIAARVGAG